MDSLARYSYPVINWDDVRDCPFAKEEWVTPYDVDNSLCDFRKGSFPRAYCENVLAWCSAKGGTNNCDILNRYLEA